MIFDLFLTHQQNIEIDQQIFLNSAFIPNPLLDGFGTYQFSNTSQSSLASILRTLTFGEGFNQPLQKVSFPSHLKILRFGAAFNQTLRIFPEQKRIET